MNNKKLVFSTLSLGFAVTRALAGQESAIAELPAVEIVDTAPLPGIDLPKEQIPAPVQTATDQDIAITNAVNVNDFMNRALGSVYVNEIQGNPFQADVNYRGYSASPLLGTPQGLSVYMDGVRLNQPFGDVVSWDLIPKSAISSMAVMPGSNPLFGRNTLGGALSIQTKDGIRNPGTTGQAIYGEYDRHAFEFEHGGSNKEWGLNWYLTGNYFKENGWRNNSPTEIRQIFGKVGWANEQTDIKFTTAYNDNQMYGNGLQEQSFLGRDHASIYTQPDITDNRALFLNLTGTHNLNDIFTLSGNSYYRNIRTQTYNGDINENSLSQNVYTLTEDDKAALDAAGIAYPAYDMDSSNTKTPYLRCIAQGLQHDEPGEKCNGLINQTSTNQENWGTALQAVANHDIFGMANRFLVGGAYDQSVVSFSQTTQLGYLNADRSITGIPSYADGETGGVVDGEPLDNRVSLKSNVTTWSFLTEDTFSITDQLHLTASGRYNHTAINNNDQIRPAGGIDSLNGNHAYERFNPAVGLAYNPMKVLNFYAGYNEGSRAPTAIELGCANPDRPCKLPNAMAGDPPLNQVVTETWEVGLRGEMPWKTNWSLGYFHAENSNDILFVADDQQGFGYFKNFGKTQRQGIEASLSHTERDVKFGNFRVGDMTVGANYTYLDATYQSWELVNGTGNSSNDVGQGEEGAIVISPGNKIPLIPEHMFKTYLDYQANRDWGMNINVIGFSSTYARGNENNAHQPDGTYYLGKGKTPGYVVTNLGVRYTPSYLQGLQVFGQINNLFDQRYYTAAQLGPTGFDASGNFVARPFSADGNNTSVRQSTFYSPGAPRIFWFGVRYSF
ncbi:MAG: TonB-dependent receptor [Candidatus Methylumidiphilus sp.]